MIENSKRISEDEMVLAFLQGEIDSPRFGHLYSQILTASDLDRSVIDHPDLQSPGENHIRRELLRLVRDYGVNNALFTGFPPDVQWKQGRLRKPNLGDLKYANEPS